MPARRDGGRSGRAPCRARSPRAGPGAHGNLRLMQRSPMRSWFSVNSSRAAGLYGQVLSSLVTFGQTIIYARTMPAEQFGLFAMATSALLVSQIVQRNAVVIPMIVAQGERRATALRPWSRINTAIAALTTGAIALVALAAWWIGDGRRLVYPLCVATAMALPTTLRYEFVRRTLFLEQRYASAVRIGAINFVLQCAGVAAVVFAGKGALAAMAAVAVAAGMASVSARAALGRAQDAPGTPTAAALLTKYRADMGWNLAAAVPYGAFNSGLPMLLGFVASPSAAGLFTATRLLLAPITTLVSAVDTVDKPRAARSLREGGRTGLLRSLRYTLVSLLAGSCAYLLIGGVFADEILGLLLGSKFPLQHSWAWLWMVVGVFVMFGQTTETGLLVLRQARWFFWSRLFAMAIGLTVLILAVPSADYVAGIVSMGTWWFFSSVLAAVLLALALGKLAPGAVRN